ncbi:MAG: DUF1552 domain-containing protein [Verrucomicrobiota bacterium]
MSSITTGKSLDRRSVLRAGGICMGLPMLDAMTPALAAGKSGPPAQRFLSMSLALGLHGPNLVPTTAGTNYQPSRYLRRLEDLRKDFTVVSGSSHPRVTGGHTAEGSILSACPNERGNTTRNSISIDQLMAKHLGHETRFPSLVLNTGSESSPSYTENGAMIPAMNHPVKLFNKLFVDDSPSVRARQQALFESGRSVMDVIGADAKRLQRQLGAGDREKLDDWFASVRELEKRLQANEAWIGRPKPKVKKLPLAQVDRNDTISVERAMLEISLLALETDSTRFVTLHLPGSARVNSLKGVDEGYHSLSHHGRDEEKLHQLALVEEAVVSEWGRFLRKLKERELLDETMVLLTSNLGNASSHSNKNMPVLLAGGGFKHGRHLAFDQKNNYPLPNLYVSALQQMGLERDSFATSTGTMTGLV